MIDCHFRLERQGFQLDVRQQLPGQGVSVLFGHSGSGKTTWLRCIAGLERAQHAFLSVNGEVWEDSQKNLYRPPYKRALGYVFQEASLFPHLNVQQNLTFGYKRVKPTPPASYLQQMIELLGIEHLLNHQPKQLSGGERQRVAIARALAVQPALLLMDEPLASLDLKRRQEILPFLTQLHNELAIPVVYVTHSPQEVNRLADYLVLLEQGEIIAAGGLEETLTRMDIQMAYSRQASTVLRVQVIAHEDEVYLTRAGRKDFSLYLPYQQHAPIGSAIRLRIYARDVSLALEPPKNSSILNSLATQIQAIRDGEPGQVVVQLKLGEKTLLSHITKKSALRLGLEVGQPIFAQIKATAIL